MDKTCGKINGKEIEYLWVKENLIVPYQLFDILGEQNVEGVQIRIEMMVMMMKVLRWQIW